MLTDIVIFLVLVLYATRMFRVDYCITYYRNGTVVTSRSSKLAAYIFLFLTVSFAGSSIFVHVAPLL